MFSVTAISIKKVVEWNLLTTFLFNWLVITMIASISLIPQTVHANRIDIAGTASLEEGHVNPGGYASHRRQSVDKSVWWPSAVTVSTQSLLRQINEFPRNGNVENPSDILGDLPTLIKGKRGQSTESEHSNPQIPTTGVRAPRGAHEYDVPQIECPNAEDGMERFACPTPDSLGRYRCIDDHVLCDGFLDCPDGSDEDRHSCMFYKTTKAHLDVLADALLRWARGRYN